ncbi:serine/threonine protein kinase [Bacillus pinisoli]|uniref:serine/threonine protein kinase n=1 Tax=Bacillus pinisoli TaxID=2901866 RepID=UPI001FF1FCF3|nr:protein kinase family protein [Bacillus pinisoli]
MFSFLERSFKKGVILKERYILQEYIGKGSYGIVYKALDQLNLESVMIKQARKRKKQESAGLLEREASMLSSLDHHNIPRCIEYFTEDNKSFLVMEAKKGKNVEDLIFRDRKIFTEVECLKLFHNVLEIINYVHSEQVIHRDLRLPNILINDKEVSIIDFGLAARFGERLDQYLLQSMPLERRLYREISVKSDFYALGHFLLFLLYSDYNPSSRTERSWEEELSIHPQTKVMIKRLLQLDGCYYDSARDIISEIESIMGKLK